MKRNEDFSDEVLNAFIDGELDHDERTQILSALRKDQHLTQRVCDLQKVRGLVQLAYSDETLPQAIHSKIKNDHAGPKYSFVAMSLILFGIFVGWKTSQSYYLEENVLNFAEEVRDFPVHKNSNTWHVMLHVSNNDPRRFNILLNETEYLLKTHKKNHQPIEIELLANGKGINLLKDKGSVLTEKLEQLTDKYPNLILSACGQTLARLEKDTGEKVTLLPGTNVVRSALYQVTKRQKEGWSYFRI